MVFTLDPQGEVHPVDPEIWDRWMEETGGKVKTLIRGNGGLSVGLRFIGKSHGWGKQMRPLVWQVALLANKKSVVTSYAEDPERGIQIVLDGIEGVIDEAPFLVRVKLRLLIWKLRRIRGKIKDMLLKKIGRE